MSGNNAYELLNKANFQMAKMSYSVLYDALYGIPDKDIPTIECSGATQGLLLQIELGIIWHSRLDRNEKKILLDRLQMILGGKY